MRYFTVWHCGCGRQVALKHYDIDVSLEEFIAMKDADLEMVADAAVKACNLTEKCKSFYQKIYGNINV